VATHDARLACDYHKAEMAQAARWVLPLLRTMRPCRPPPGMAGPLEVRGKVPVRVLAS